MNEILFWHSRTSSWFTGGIVLAALGLTACESQVGTPPGMMLDGPMGGPSSGAGAAAGTTAGDGTATTTQGAAVTGATGTTAATGTTGGGVVVEQPADCVGTTLGASKRLVRLTFNQLARSVGALFGDALGDQVKATFEIGDLSDRAFPPLASPREGSLFIESIWQSSDAIAQLVGEHVFANFAAVTGCAAPATAECGQAYVLSLAERAFRRPLVEREAMRLAQVFAEAQAAGGTVEEATQYGTYAVMQSPHYLYRTEFGTNVYAEETLTGHELASQLAYFITDGPPDAELLAAAASGQLASVDQLRVHADRLLGTPGGRQNLQSAALAYFRIPALDSVVIDPELAPDFNNGLRNSMRRESELFLSHTLWSGALGDLLTSRTAFINENLAGFYGVAYPPAGSTPDAEGFAAVELDANRSGLLSNPGFLTGRSRPDVPSVVGRGILVNDTLLCTEVPPVPENLAEEIAQVSETLAGASEREIADYRMGTPPCSGCHIGIDPYGLALENFDIIGKYRTADDQGRPIDAQVTLPDGTVTNTVPELANHLVVSGQFAACMTKHFIDYSLAEVSQDLKVDSCAVKAVLDRFNTTSQTFTDLIREIAASSTMAVRSPGGM